MRVLDYNECDPAEGIHDIDCGTGAICINTMGSYSCQCDTGYTGTAPQCTGEVTKMAIFVRVKLRLNLIGRQIVHYSRFHNNAIIEKILIRYFSRISNNRTTYFSFTEIETHPPLYFGMLASIFHTYLLTTRETVYFMIPRLSKKQ